MNPLIVEDEAKKNLADKDWDQEKKDAYLRGYKEGAFWAEKVVIARHEENRQMNAWKNMNTPIGDDHQPDIPRVSPEKYQNIIIPTLIRCGAIPKNMLEVGVTYKGYCRNADKATWLGDKFEYTRYKWGDLFKEKINHFEDDNGYDLFVPYSVV